MRLEITQQNVQSEEALHKQTQYIQEIADVLRKNIVQGERVNDPNTHGDIYRE